MAARTRKVQHDAFTRQKIQTSQIVNRLTDHVLGKVELTSSQVNAAGILLRKSLPDLQSTTVTGEDGGAVKLSVAVEYVKAGS
jgi:hypothetical protein